MLLKVKRENYNLILSLMSNSHLSLNILPIIYQTFNGEIWVDNLTHPSYAYVFDSRHGHFILGQMPDKLQVLTDFIFTLFKNRFFDTNQFFYLFYASDWIKLLKGHNVLSKIIFNQKKRQLYKFNKFSLKDWKSLVPEGFTVLPVDKDLLSKDLKNMNYLKDELIQMWGAVDNFFKIGFGTCAIFQDSLAGFCLGEYFVQTEAEKKFGIGIETFPKFQKKSIATAMTSLLVEMGRKENYSVYWDCFKDNIASAKTALKTGFVLDMEYDILLGHF